MAKNNPNEVESGLSNIVRIMYHELTIDFFLSVETVFLQEEMKQEIHVLNYQ